MIPVPRMFCPVTVGAGTTITFQIDGSTITRTSTVPAGFYPSPESLLSVVATGMSAQAGRTVSVSLDADGHVVVTISSGTIRLTGGAGLSLLGLEAVDFFAPAIQARKQMPRLWLPGEPCRSDSEDVQVVEEGFQRGLTGVHRAVQHGGWYERSVVFEFLPEERVKAPAAVPSPGALTLDADTIALWPLLSGGTDSGGAYDLTAYGDGSYRRIGDPTLAVLLKGDVTLEATITLDASWSADGAVFEYGDWGETEASNFLCLIGVDANRHPYVAWESGAGIDHQVLSDVVLPTGKAIALVVTRSGGVAEIRIGGWTVAINDLSPLPPPTGGTSPSSYIWIGNRASTGGASPFNGTIRHVRLSKTVRAAPAVANDRSFPWAAAKSRFRWWPDASDLNTWGDYYLIEPRRRWEPTRMFPRPALYRVELSFSRYV